MLFFVLFVFASSTLNFGEDPYKILGVPRSASEKEIKEAYHRLTKKLHPDRTKEKSSEKWMKVADAYELLMDSARRKSFDRSGSVADDSEQPNYQDAGPTLNQIDLSSLKAFVQSGKDCFVYLFHWHPDFHLLKLFSKISNENPSLNLFLMATTYQTQQVLNYHSIEAVAYVHLDEYGEMKADIAGSISSYDDFMQWMEKVFDSKIEKLKDFSKLQKWLKKQPEFEHYLIINYERKITLEMKRIIGKYRSNAVVAVISDNYPEIIRELNLVDFPAIMKFSSVGNMTVLDFEKTLSKSRPQFIKLTRKSSQIYCQELCLVSFDEKPNYTWFRRNVFISVLVENPSSLLAKMHQIKSNEYLIASAKFRKIFKASREKLLESISRGLDLKFTASDSLYFTLNYPLSERMLEMKKNIFDSVEFSSLFKGFLFFLFLIMMIPFCLR